MTQQTEIIDRYSTAELAFYSAVRKGEIKCVLSKQNIAVMIELRDSYTVYLHDIHVRYKADVSHMEGLIVDLQQWLDEAP